MSSPAFAQKNDNVLTADRPLTSADLSAHIDYILDPDWTKTITDIIDNESGNFAPIQMSEPNFGYIDEKIWLRIKVQNTTQDIEQWRLYAHENFLQYYDAYVLRENGEINHIESHNLNSRFSDRKIAYPELVSPFNFLPQETITVYISYWSGGSSHMELSIETADSFAIKAMTRTSKNFISYGMMAILIVASVLAFLVLRMNVLLAYLGYVFVTLLYLMHGDGVAFQFLWPNFPRFNSYFSITVGTAFVMATYCFAIVFLQTRTYHPAIHRVLLALFWLTPLITIPGALIDPQWTKRAIFVLVFVGIFAGACVGLKAAMTRFRDVRFFLFAWVCGILSAGLMNMRHIFGLDIAQDTVFDSIRVAIVVDAIMMGLGVADRYSQILRSRQRATEQNLIDAQRNLKLNTRLMSLEEQYQLAVEMVASRDKSLRDTVHDLKQPLHALRLNLQSSKDGTPHGPQQDYNVDEAFSYLETLIANHLRQSIGESETLVPPPEHPSDEDELDLPKVLQSIYEMFEKDASDKGLEFRFVKTRQRTNIEPLVLMRIVTNLVSNAVKYTPSGKILLGARKNKNSLRIEVHDTGLGLTQAEFKNAQTRHKRLHHDQVDVQGQGLGLSIASELAKTHGLELYIMPGRKNGTSLILEVPK